MTSAAPSRVSVAPAAPRVVHKFGGTCVASAQRLDEVARYLTSLPPERPIFAVVSAMGSSPLSPVKVTDLLLNSIAKAAARDDTYIVDLAALQEKHTSTARELLGSDSRELASFAGSLLSDVANLRSTLHALHVAGASAAPFEDWIVGHGELWCARLVAARCRQLEAEAELMDARETLVVAPASDGVSVDVVESDTALALDRWASAHLSQTPGWSGGEAEGGDEAGAEQRAARDAVCPHIVVATGFVARSTSGAATTLKRNGSDYSATLFGAALRAGEIVIWTDVDGVYSADPRRVPDAVCLVALAYHEAWELSYFGANVLHPRTTLPAMDAGIPIAIRNFFNRAAPGTVIASAEALAARDCAPLPRAAGVKGLATIEGVSLINVEGTGMVGVPGTASAIFSVMRDARVNVIMISQASSEHSVCFAVRAADEARATAALRERFADLLASGRISAIAALPDCCVLAAVGQGMASRRGVAATLFAALAKASVNIRAIAQGCSEYNITVLIDGADATKALRAVHGRFYLDALPLGIGLVGRGLIGSALLQQLEAQRETLLETHRLDVRVLGIASSSKMLVDPRGLDLKNWEAAFETGAQPLDLQAFGLLLAGSGVPNVVAVDCTASDEPPAMYAEWMRQGLHVVTPNKRLNSGPLPRHEYIRARARESYIHYLYEATVGAGLPVVATLQHLVASGDRVRRIEGVFSGTLSFLFNSFAPRQEPFSAVVAQARAQGFTEPDPRDDLGGQDVARKVVILARECGIDLELSDVDLVSLVPEPLRDASAVSPDEFMRRLPEFDSGMAEMAAQAEAQGECLRFVGVVDVEQGKGSVELRRYPRDHAFAQLSGSDNIIAFHTARYNQQPLIVRGPGAGAEVTAGGVFSDLLRLAAYVGAPS